MQIVVQLAPRHADAAHGRAEQTPEVRELLGQLSSHRASLQPMHPGETDPHLAPHFTVEADASQADELLAVLRSSPAVDGAYVKPPSAPP